MPGRQLRRRIAAKELTQGLENHHDNMVNNIWRHKASDDEWEHQAKEHDPPILTTYTATRLLSFVKSGLDKCQPFVHFGYVSLKILLNLPQLCRNLRLLISCEWRVLRVFLLSPKDNFSGLAKLSPHIRSLSLEFYVVNPLPKGI